MVTSESNEKFREFLTALFQVLKAADSELCAFELALKNFKTTYHDKGAGPFFDVALSMAKQSASLQETTRQKYDVPVEQFLSESAQSDLDLDHAPNGSNLGRV